MRKLLFTVYEVTDFTDDEVDSLVIETTGQCESNKFHPEARVVEIVTHDVPGEFAEFEWTERI